MNEFAMNLSVQNNDRSLKQTSRSDSLAYREAPYEFPYGNIILNLFNNKVPSVSTASLSIFSLDCILLQNTIYCYYLLTYSENIP